MNRKRDSLESPANYAGDIDGLIITYQSGTAYLEGMMNSHLTLYLERMNNHVIKNGAQTSPTRYTMYLEGMKSHLTDVQYFVFIVMKVYRFVKKKKRKSGTA